MRTLVDIPQEDIEALDRRSRVERTSRAAIIRAAVRDYLKEQDRADRHAAIRAGFGLWKDRGIDGVAYERQIRDEWERGAAE